MASINSATTLSAKKELKSGGAAPPAGPFEKAVVTKILLDQTQIALVSADIKKIDPGVQVDRVPRNTLIVRRITDGADSAGQSAALAYPFFSSHFVLPVKIGETVWVIFDKEERKVGYWMSRVHGDEISEDLNYSHYDRGVIPKEQPVEGPGTADKAEKTTPGSTPPADDFPNLSLKQAATDVSEYELILKEASTSPQALEPVPRISRRPGDLVIHGSNNSMISLSTDRGWNKDEDPTDGTSNAHVMPLPFAGVIDIVSGRARWISNSEKLRTIPEVTTNSRGFVETTKDPRKKKVATKSEGDPDFLDDASRVYVSTLSNIDARLALTDFTPITPGETEIRAFVETNSAIALKSDQIRLVARKDETHEVNGSIKIIKEGEKTSGGDHCAISLLEDGTVLITGNKIFIGRSKTDGGLEEGDPEAPGTTQPYVKYKQLEDLLKAIIADVTSFCNTVSTHTTPGYGAPSPQLNSAASSLKSAMKSRESEIVNLRSARIFGE